MDRKLFWSIILLLGLGVVMSCSFSGAVARRIGLDEYYFFWRQMIFALISVLLLLLLMNLNTTTAQWSGYLLVGISLAMLLLVPLVGFHTKGAQRWLYIGGFSLQPSELLKPSLILLNAHLLTRISPLSGFRNLWISLFIQLAAMLLLLKQPDIGTFALLNIIFFLQLLLTDFFGFRHCLYMLLLLLSSFGLVAVASSHVIDRISNFLVSFKDPARANYQVKMSLRVYRSATWFGRGFLEGEIKNHIPDVHTDFIFPAIVEEFGILPTLLLLTLYFYLTIRVMLLAQRRSETRLALIGLALLLLLQACINICVSLNLVPTKGITLPFLSYGGSSLLGATISAGYLLVFTKKEFGLRISSFPLLGEEAIGMDVKI